MGSAGPQTAADWAKRCVDLLGPSLGPYLVVPPMTTAAQVRRVTAALDVESGHRDAVADALNVVMHLSADLAEPMRVSEWPDLLPRLVTLVAGVFRWDEEYAKRLAVRVATRDTGGSRGVGRGMNGLEGVEWKRNDIVWEATGPATATLGRAVVAGYSRTTGVADVTPNATSAQVRPPRPPTTRKEEATHASTRGTIEASATAAAAAQGVEPPAGPSTPPELETGASKRRRTDCAGTSADCGGITDVALWARVDDEAGTEEGARADVTAFACAAMSALRNLSFVAANRSAIAACDALVPVLARCVAAGGAGWGPGNDNDADVVPPRMAADAADVLFNAQRLLVPTPELVAAVCSALEGDSKVGFAAYETDALGWSRARLRHRRRQQNEAAHTGNEGDEIVEEGDEDDSVADAVVTADLRCSAAGLLAYLLVPSSDGDASERCPSDAQLQRAVDALTSNLPQPVNPQNAYDLEADSEEDEAEAAEEIVCSAAARVGIACCRALCAFAAHKAAAETAAGNPRLIDRVMALARTGATPQLRTAALEVMADIARSPAGRDRLRVHEECLLNIAVVDRHVAEKLVMLTLSRMAWRD